MARTASPAAILTVPYAALVDSFTRSLHAENKAPKTIRAYVSACEQLLAFLTSKGMPTEVSNIHREHVEAFIADQLARLKPASAHNRYRSLQSFFRWCVEEGEVKANPMVNMKPPIIPEDLPGVLSEEQITTLLKTCSGRAYDELRDIAIIRLLLDTGMRLSECSELTIDKINFTTSVAVVVGKGRRERACYFGRKTAQAIDRYLRARYRHKSAHSPFLWLGREGKLTDDGVYQVVKRRGKEAGLDLHPHLFRHTFAHMWMAEGAGETDLMALAGWRSRTMLARYGASAASARAGAAHARLGLMDRI